MTHGSRWLLAGPVGLAACLNLAVTGQTPSPRQGSAQTLPANSFILGRVIDAGTGEGIAGVVVTLTGGGGVTEAAIDARLLAQFERGLIGAEQLGRPGTRRAITDADGRFLFRDLTRGSYTATTRHADYAPGAFGRRRIEGPARPIELADNEKVTDATIRLWRLASLSGTITDEAGEPVVGLAVRALRRTQVRGRSVLTTTQFAQTDDRGWYRLSGLIPAEYVVVVPHTTTTLPISTVEAYREANESKSSTQLAEIMRASEESDAPFPNPSGMQIGNLIVQTLGNARGSLLIDGVADGRALVYPSVFYPSASPGQGPGLGVGSGEHRTGADFTVRPVPWVQVSGLVTGPDGAATNLGVRLIPADTAHLSSSDVVETAVSATDGSGRFTFLGVPSGQYVVRAHRRSGTPATPGQPGAAMLWAELPVSVGNTAVSDLQLSLRPAARLSGQIVFDGTAARPTPQQMPQISVSLTGVDFQATMLSTAARAGADGRFSTSGHAPGRYSMNVSAPAARDWTLRSIVVGNVNVIDRPLVLEGSDIGDVVVTFTDRVTEVSGTVQGVTATSDEGFLAVLLPADHQSWIASGMFGPRLVQATVDKAGTFRARVTLPGDYLAVAMSLEFGGEFTPELIATLARSAVRVSVAEGDKKTVSLPVVRIK